MKISLALQPRRPLNRSEAWGCLTANLALPGAGSLVAGRRIGYVQMVLAEVGMLVSLAGGIRFFIWYAANSGRLSAEPPLDDPFGNLILFWTHVRWALAGIAMVGCAILWALTTSMDILNHASRDAVPPPLP
jgi:hypothetical protein